jgi:drug/metabolite transporter (DMT)-like permease
MSRLRADLLLLLVAIIWGAAFIPQNNGMKGLGPYGFNGSRFLLSLLVVLPFAIREARTGTALTRRDWFQGAILCSVFFIGVVMQQVGMLTTTVTNAGFLTGLYAVLTPVVALFLFGKRPHWVIGPACVMAFAGAWLLNGASLSAFKTGDWLMLVCALSFAVQVPLLGLLVQRTGRPLAFVAMQYAFCTILGLSVALFHEGISLHALNANLPQISFAGIISGGIAYTLQAVAQQHTPPSDAAIIMSGESLFASLFGVALLGEHLTLLGWIGCAMILSAMLIVEAGVIFFNKMQRAS